MKTSLGATNCLFPMPVVLLGANVNGRPNYMTVAWDGIVDFKFVSVAIARPRFTYSGIKENRTFSLNIPSANMLALVDYCGTASGKKVDKGKIFENFYGKLGSAPMIQACPTNMECRLVRVIEGFPTHDLLVGEIVETYCDEACQTDGEVDWSKVRPILFTGTDSGYWELGERLGTVGRSPIP
jgi:flavin reductase (DIM6/NTAB) family NADH-FMN oxidoreductase RutF